MGWIQSVIDLFLDGSWFAYRTVAEAWNGLFEVLMNFVSSTFLYILAKTIELFIYFFDMLPPIPGAGDNFSGVNCLLGYVVLANDFVPVYEICVLFSFYVTFLIAFISIKMILKLIPMIG